MPASTRALYERKLRNLLQCDGHDGLNGAEKAVLYSDSEEEGEGNMEEEEKESGMTRIVFFNQDIYGWFQITLTYLFWLVQD